jgi:hypothetical protein
VTVTVSRVGVLRIHAEAKRPAAAPSTAAKEKQVKIDARSPLSSAAPHKVWVRPQAPAVSYDSWVAYCAMLDLPSVESCSSSSSDSYGLESIFALPPLILDLHISMELPHVTEVLEAEVAQQEVPVETEAHVVCPEG